MEKPLVSVIVPCYNGERFIDRCLRSIYAQEYPELEVIVVDDGSTDRSKEIISAWSEKFDAAHKGLKYVFQQNQGLGGAINTGLKHIAGDYLSLLDADDEFLPGCIPERVEFLAQHPEMDAVRSNGYMTLETDRSKRYLFVQEDENEQEDVFRALLRGETNNWAGSYMVRTCTLFRFYPQREIYTSRYGQNLQLLLPVTYRKKCGFINRPHMNYIRQPQSLSQTENPQDCERRSLENARGYLDIRLHMLNEIVSDKGKKDPFLKDIYIGYWHGIMRIAVQFSDVQLMKDAFQELKLYKQPDIHDKILYYGLCSKPKWYFYRIIRRCKGGKLHKL